MIDLDLFGAVEINEVDNLFLESYITVFSAFINGIEYFIFTIFWVLCIDNLAEHVFIFIGIAGGSLEGVPSATPPEPVGRTAIAVGFVK